MFLLQGKKGPLPTENRSPLISNTAGMNNIIVYDGSTLLVIDANSVNLNAGSSALQEEMARERIVREKILGSYNFTFPNGPCKSDGCYHLHLHNADGKTISRTVKAKTIEELKDKIYKYHKDMLPSSLTFAEMFQQAQQDVFRYVKQDSDAYHSKLNSSNRRQQLFDRFIAGTSWEKKKITTFTVQDIDDLILYNLQRYDLRTRALSSLKSIIRMTFDYAVSHGCIRHNPYPDLDSRRYRDLLVPDAPVRERGYTEDELNRILNYLHQKEESDPKCTTSWALELVVICALRGSAPSSGRYSMGTSAGAVSSSNAAGSQEH